MALHFAVQHRGHFESTTHQFYQITPNCKAMKKVIFSLYSLHTGHPFSPFMYRMISECIIQEGRMIIMHVFAPPPQVCIFCNMTTWYNYQLSPFGFQVPFDNEWGCNRRCTIPGSCTSAASNTEFGWNRSGSMQCKRGWEGVSGQGWVGQVALGSVPSSDL